jgi:ABC-2 type transport system ATP-binding protein
MTAVCAQGVGKRYGRRLALSDVDLGADRGEIVALVGPNGAGKTTLLEIFAGFRRRDTGSVRVLGRDPWRAPRELRGRIGVLFQNTRLDERLTVKETLDRFAAAYRSGHAVGTVLSMVNLQGSDSRQVASLSGGEQRRLAIGVAIVGQPDVLLLDEPTGELDPAARHLLWDLLRRLRGTGVCVLLTTHHLYEAELLADRVAFMSDGRAVAVGSPEALAGPGVRVQFTLQPAQPRTGGLSPGRMMRRSLLYRNDAEALIGLAKVERWARRGGATVSNLSVARATLEDAYLRHVAPRPPPNSAGNDDGDA